MKSFIVLVTCVLASTYGAALKSNSSTIAISLYATDLSGCDPFSACDASVTILCSSIYSDWKICDQTKKIQNNNNPVWPEVFNFEHVPGTSQRWRLDLKDHDVIGQKLIASFSIIVDDYEQREGPILRNDTPDNRGTLWVQRVQE